MHSTPRRLALLAGAAALLCVSAAVAQDAPPPPGPPPMMEDGPGAPGGPPMMMMHRHRDPEARAQHLRDVLQLRPDQDGALKAYLAATEPKAWGKDDDKNGPDMKPAADGPPPRLTTPERLDREAEHLARATEAFKARAAATRTFYAALSPSQQKAFDALGPMLGEHGPMLRRIEVRRMNGAPPASGRRKPS
ncbi:Spy/CpxP family protein refolding chaperone [Caulobacter sp. LARHSG274]